MATIMERLAFGSDQRFTAIEAAIHLNRYLLVRRHCAGRKVLDLACGEGYGAYLMAERWGAAEVHGVDIAPEAIQSARQHFASPRITYHCLAAENLGQVFREGEFDLIVSLETIEHLQDPEGFLRTLKRHCRPDGQVVITCPNDHWYYKDGSQSNPFHVRKYTFQEFRTLAESVLGRASAWLMGTALAGYVNRLADDELAGRGNESFQAMLAAHDRVEALLAPTEERITWENCLYYAGIWGDAEERTRPTLAAFACAPDSSEPATRQAQVAHLRDEVVHLRQELYDTRRRASTAEASEAEVRRYVHESEQARAALLGQLDSLRKRVPGLESLREPLPPVDSGERRRASLHIAALRAENEYIREEFARTRGQLAAVERERASLVQRLAEREQVGAENQRAAAQRIAELERMVAERDAYIHETWIAKFKRVGGKIARRLRGRDPGS